MKQAWNRLVGGDAWFAVLYVVVAAQLGHVGEHVAQMVQIHVLGLTGPNARGIVGTLDVEWVHFIWNVGVLVAVLVLLIRFRTDAWLRLTVILASWHALEHAYLLYIYVTTGLAGTPGLAAQGGAIAGGLPITRPDLHFIYNVVETTPLLVAFLRQAKQRGSYRTVRRARASASQVLIS